MKIASMGFVPGHGARGTGQLCAFCIAAATSDLQQIARVTVTVTASSRAAEQQRGGAVTAAIRGNWQLSCCTYVHMQQESLRLICLAKRGGSTGSATKE